MTSVAATPKRGVSLPFNRTRTKFSRPQPKTEGERYMETLERGRSVAGSEEAPAVNEYSKDIIKGGNFELPTTTTGWVDLLKVVAVNKRLLPKVLAKLKDLPENSPTWGVIERVAKTIPGYGTVLLGVIKTYRYRSKLKYVIPVVVIISVLPIIVLASALYTTYDSITNFDLDTIAKSMNCASKLVFGGDTKKCVIDTALDNLNSRE